MSQRSLISMSLFNKKLILLREDSQAIKFLLQVCNCVIFGVLAEVHYHHRNQRRTFSPPPKIPYSLAVITHSLPISQF